MLISFKINLNQITWMIKLVPQPVLAFGMLGVVMVITILVLVYKII
jgi:hypothetical protein